MNRVIEGGTDEFLAVLQKRRDEAVAAKGRHGSAARQLGVMQGLDFAMHAVRDWQVPAPPKTWLYGLTADEWLHLASEGTESEVQPCCGNVSQIRELLQALSTCQAPYDGWMQASLGGQLLELLGDEDEGEHGLNNETSFPLLHRVLTGIRAQRAEQHAEQQARQAEALQRRENGPQTMEVHDDLAPDAQQPGEQA